MLTELSCLALAFVVGQWVQRYGVPVMVGYLLAGAVLGGFGVVPSEVLLGAAHAGVLLLLFGVGLHLRLRNLLDRATLVGGNLHLIISTTVFFALTVPFGLPPLTALFLGVILGFSSTVLAAKDLENREELGAYYGRLSIGILLIQDLVALLVILCLGGDAPSPWVLGLPLLLLLRPLLARLIMATQEAELLLLLTVLLALGCAAGFEALGLPGEVGALLIGALLADHARADEMQSSIWSLKEFFLLGFFLQVGMQALPEMDRLLPVLGWSLLLLLVLPFKAGLFFAILTRVGLRARTAFLTGSTLTSYSEFTLMAGMIGVESGIISAEILSILALVTAISFAINLPINRLVNTLYERWETLLLRFERHGDGTDKPLRSIGRASHLVVGMGRTGIAAYDYLREQGLRPVGMDVDPVVLQRQLALGRRVVFADALDPELWDSLNLRGVEGVVMAVPNFNARRRGCEKLKNLRPELRITTYALSDGERPLLHAAGADDVHHILADAGVHLGAAVSGTHENAFADTVEDSSRI